MEKVNQSDPNKCDKCQIRVIYNRNTWTWHSCIWKEGESAIVADLLKKNFTAPQIQQDCRSCVLQCLASLNNAKITPDEIDASGGELVWQNKRKD
ncbi:MAG: hypothetical protein WCJ84_05235 [Candidatus Peregrinibacteria bacterium]